MPETRICSDALTHHRARRLFFPLAACALALGTAPTPAIAAPADPAPLLLRLPDLGPGYVIGGLGLGFSHVKHSCTVLRPSIRPLRRALGPGTYRGCLLSFLRAWTPPGGSPDPTGVRTLAFAFDTPAGPTTALSHPRALPALFGLTRLRVVGPAPSIGDQSVLMHFDKIFLGLHFSAGIVVWRSGSMLAMVIAASLTKGDAIDRTAVSLAAVQQGRIATPTPLLPSVNDDRLVLLDNPTLGVPVMWLGERLPEHGRFPALDLHETDQPFDLGGDPQPLVRLVYSTPSLPETAKVELWQPRALRRSLRRPPYPYQCQRRFDVNVPGARAWIDATYLREPRRASGRCPHRGAVNTAIAFFDDVAVTIDTSGCCRSVFAPYDSMAGLRTLLRALRPRPLPTP
jgi:hypothetical protein